MKLRFFLQTNVLNLFIKNPMQNHVYGKARVKTGININLNQLPGSWFIYT
jgi:hypothetical protein